MASTAKKEIRSSVPGVSFLRELEGIQEYTLDSNGLRILLISDTSAPVAGCMVTYHVGSRNEAIGFTGATHMLEHLMFNGSSKFPKESGKVTDFLEAKGALLNATTFFDRTNYYEVLPMEHLPLAITFEADRMRTAFIREEDRSKEMTVVRNEFERGENDPHEALEKQLWAVAYQAHPYHHSTIGWRSDIEEVPIERLQQFYDEFYWPDNATVTIAGNFDQREVLELVQQTFGQHPRAPKPYPAMYTKEPAQEGERRAIVKRSGADIVGIAHKIPEGNHPDMAALLVLDSILSNGKTSRLYRGLVDTRKALEVNVLLYQLHDPSLVITFATLTPDTPHQVVEKKIKDIYEEIKTKGVTAKELSFAKRAIRVANSQQRDGLYSLLSSLNEDLATGDWTRFVTLPHQIEKVTAKDVQRVARTYFVDDQSTVGWFINTEA